MAGSDPDYTLDCEEPDMRRPRVEGPAEGVQLGDVTVGECFDEAPVAAPSGETVGGGAEPSGRLVDPVGVLDLAGR